MPHRAREGGSSPSHHLAWTSDKRVAASASVCSFTDTQNTVTLPELFTVCFNRLVLRINNESSALSTLHCHTANLNSISEDFHHFSTKRVCPLPLKLVFSISLGFLGAFSHNSLFPLLTAMFPTAYLTN